MAAGDIRIGKRRQRRHHEHVVCQGLPDDYYQQYCDGQSGRSLEEDVLRVAKKYLDLDHLAIVIVGDRAAIEGPLKATGIAPIAYLDDLPGAPATTP